MLKLLKVKKKKLTTNNTLFGKVINQKLVKIKSFPNKKKLKKFITAEVALQTSVVVQWFKTLLATARDVGSIPGPGRFHMPWGN